jgi:PleD family two-component response regulator
MPPDPDRRRLVLAARPSEASALLSQFARAPLDKWNVENADTFERARFLLQHNPCDILMVDEGLYQDAGALGLAWLAGQREVPILFMTAMEPELVAQAYRNGAHLCLPRQLALHNTSVLSAALERMAQLSDMQRSSRRTKDNLNQCRRQIDRLVNLLWRTVPMDPERQWFTQRHILERLQEEVCRSGRHGSVFTLALGEVQAAEPSGEVAELAEWTTETLSRTKRRCDVAGHYGLQGFMLLLMETPKAGGVACCKRLQQYLGQAARPPRGPRGPINACFGLSTFSADNAASQSLLSRAEKHLEAAKAGTCGGVVAD